MIHIFEQKLNPKKRVNKKGVILQENDDDKVDNSDNGDIIDYTFVS